MHFFLIVFLCCCVFVVKQLLNNRMGAHPIVEQLFNYRGHGRIAPSPWIRHCD